ncbi:MAG TPA: ABC transporter ATP-binding protein [Candidatus Aquicultor sp.]|jgi:lipopolysaccharide transport system ATP-binding protein
MSDISISIENLFKQYRLGVIGHGTLTHDIQSWWARFTGKVDPNSKININAADSSKQADGFNERFWALSDVSFDVAPGEVLGIIGRNGAGKSTLLKILSRVTTPTKGMVKIRGRVASLLEVGTGFHPELTGRENVYLNGAILGMTKHEITKKFEEIISFAEVEKFIDTPVKRYSSGMYVRLAFAVAAHLEPEILIVDEVLAVGDTQFQKKCLGKMEDVSKEGRTVLFVSHNMQAIRNLCPKSILLNKGSIASEGATDTVLNTYNQLLRSIEIDAETDISNELNRRGLGVVRFTSAEAEDIMGQKRFSFQMGETIRIKISYKVFKRMQGLIIYVGLRSGATRDIVTSAQHLVTSDTVDIGTNGTIIIELPDIFIRPGEYPLYLHLSDANMSSTSIDVLDDLTPPLVISAGNIARHSNFNPAQPIGYFSIPSHVVLNEIYERSSS